MADNTDNLTLKLLQEIRKEMNTRFDVIDKRFDAVDERFDEVEARIGGLTHVIILLANNASQHEDRLENLEVKK